MTSPRRSRTSTAAARHRTVAGHRTAIACTGALVALVLAGCTGALGDDQGDDRAAASPTASGTTTFEPVTLDNCGTAVTVEAPPQRVVTIKSTATEMLLALGLEDSLVGTAFADGPPPATYRAAYAAVPVLSEQVPGQEALLAADPDFVYGGWESNFSADGAGDRASLDDRGIGTYVSPSACKEDGDKPDPLTFDDVDDEIREVADIFGVPDRAEALIAAQRATVAAVTPPAAATTALWYSSGSDIPYVGAGIGAPQMIMDAAGITNIFANVHDTWTPAGWEQVVAADPDVIILIDASWNTADKKIALLEANPATSQLSAVRGHRYLTLPFPSSEAGVRNADAVASLANQLAALPPVS